MSSPQFFNRAGSQTLITGRIRVERESDGERERQHGACTRIFCLGLFSWNLEAQCLGQPINLLPMRTHARIQKVMSVGVQLCNSDNVFAFFRRADPNITKIGPSSARQRNAI